MKYLKSDYLIRFYPYKICLVCNNKKRLKSILLEYPIFKLGSKKRCGWVGFIYFDNLKEALKVREKFYFDKTMYVFLQYDKPIIENYSINLKKPLDCQGIPFNSRKGKISI